MHNRVTALDINDRIDAEYYSKEFMNNEAKLSLLGDSYIEELVDKSKKHNIADLSSNGSFAYLREIQYSTKEGMPFIRTQNIQENFISTDDLIFIDKRSISKVYKSVCREGNLMVCRKGKVGTTAIIPSDLDNSNCSENVTRFILDHKKTNPYYCSLFLNTYHGNLRLIREATGVIQKWINNEKLRKIKIFTPVIQAQNYIGDKVRLAESLRERARELEAEIKQFFSISYWTGEKVGNHQSYRTNSAVINPQRLDTAFYDPAHLHLEEVLQNNNAVPLSKQATQVKKTWNKSSEEFYYLEIGEINLSIGSITPKRLLAKDAPSRAKLLVKPWDVLVSTVRPNRKNIALVPEVDSDIPIVASTGFSVIRFKSKEATIFYHCWLRSDAATQQLMRWNSGGSYPAIDDDVALSILVPNYPENLIEKQGRRWMIKLIGEEFSERLTTAAKLLVEAIIEGKITEEELKTAQQALQKSDREPDKAILSSLTRKGIDIKGEPPLFPDLDQLYELIDKITKDGEEEQ